MVEGQGGVHLCPPSGQWSGLCNLLHKKCCGRPRTHHYGQRFAPVADRHLNPQLQRCDPKVAKQARQALHPPAIRSRITKGLLNM